MKSPFKGRQVAAKNAEFYEAVRLLQGSRLNLGSPCDCTETIKAPPNDAGQILATIDSLERAIKQLIMHLERYYWKELHDN